MRDIIIIDDKLLDDLISQARVSPRLRVNLDLRDSAQDGSQRMLNSLIPGTQLPIHRHRGTSETVFVLRGAIEEIFYNEKGVEFDRCLLSAREGVHGVQIPMGVWHTVIVKEECVIVEMKEGGYMPQKGEDVWNSERGECKCEGVNK